MSKTLLRPGSIRTGKADTMVPVVRTKMRACRARSPPLVADVVGSGRRYPERGVDRCRPISRHFGALVYRVHTLRQAMASAYR